MKRAKNAADGEGRISVRVPVGSDLKERLDNAVKVTGVPGTVIILRAVEAALDYIEETSSVTFPLMVKPRLP